MDTILDIEADENEAANAGGCGGGIIIFTAAKYYAPGNDACAALSNALSVTKEECDYRYHCGIDTTPGGLLYSDPCPGSPKKLEVRQLEYFVYYLHSQPMGIW